MMHHSNKQNFLDFAPVSAASRLWMGTIPSGKSIHLPVKSLPKVHIVRLASYMDG